ncbi:hypothetical protein ACFVAJ_05250 [Agromyces sp. NPDC057679]|uniref:hypothetical protein n=1 Tax=Agromyces sp. NPDC057679 TaxID=3346207 RepID=UPI00366AEFD3
MSDGTGEQPTPTRPRGRRAAPPAVPASPLAKATALLAAVVDALARRSAPAVAAVTSWASAHRAVALTGAAALLSIGIIAGGAAVIQAGSAGAPGTEASSELETPRPTPSAPANSQAFPPVLPTSTPAPPEPTAVPIEPTDEPVADEPDEPVDDPVVEPEPEPDPSTDDDHPGRGQGPKKPKG